MQKLRYLTFPLLLALAACSDCEGGGLTEVRAAIVVDPMLLDMGEVVLGVRAQGALTVRNRGNGALDLSEVTLVEPGIFAFVEPPFSALGPSLSGVLTVEATPDSLGEHKTRLKIVSNDPDRPELSITIRLLAIEAPPCDDGNVCTEDWFDTEANDCAHRFVDGTSCESADKCIINAVCSQGVCLGEPKICKDDNPCTQDYCRQIDGECLFIEEQGICDDNNPCTTDSCSIAGCANEPVANGTACDDMDLCTRNDACFAGECRGAGAADGTTCDDLNSCTVGDTCRSGVCEGQSILGSLAEGSTAFEYPMTMWNERAFLHRREVSLSENDNFYGLDHLNLPNNQGFTHVVFSMNQCGTERFQFAYRPPDNNVLVSYVRRGIQLETGDRLRLFVGVRQRPQDGFRPQTTSYSLDGDGNVLGSQIQRLGGETGRSLLPDGGRIYGVIFPITQGPPLPNEPSQQNLVVVREDSAGRVLWRHERASWDWGEFLGVAGPRVLFWAAGRFGALDFNTGATVWTQRTAYTSDEMALSTQLNLGIIRTKPVLTGDSGQLIGFEILEGNQVFAFPPEPSDLYFPRTEPVIAADGTIGAMMQTNQAKFQPSSLEWVELDKQGQVLSRTPLPYVFPEDFGQSRHEDYRDDPYPTVADDGITYVGYGNRFWAINKGGGLRWTLTSTAENGFTGTVPVLRDDSILLISDGSRGVVGVKTNGGKMSESGWASFRHDGRRTNYTPPASTRPPL